jgi:hypothetical protein
MPLSEGRFESWRTALVALVDPEGIAAVANMLSGAINDVLGTKDDVMGTATRSITADDIKDMANLDRPVPLKGLAYDFSTEAQR